jgi:hypothetical protein
VNERFGTGGIPFGAEFREQLGIGAGNGREAETKVEKLALR